jgi:ectoine hydroxylase
VVKCPHRGRVIELSAEQSATFDRDGLLVLPDLFSAGEVALIRARLPALLAEDSASNVREKKTGVCRTAMGVHLRDYLFARLVRHPRLCGPAMQILGPDLYVQQVKVNIKAAFGGETWQWHQDFSTYHGEDGVPDPLALNLHIFLDDVSEFNGPLYFLPGSHRRGPVKASLDTDTTSYPLWVVDDELVTDLANTGGIVSATGPAGTGLIFCDTMVHGSPPNMSPWDRGIFSLILNPIANALTRHQRPDHKHHRDLNPVVPLADDCLLNDAA